MDNNTQTIGSTQPQQTSYMPLIILFLVILVLLLVGLLSYLFIAKKPQPQTLQPSTSTEITPSRAPQVKITDLAPGVPNNQKTIVLIQHSDSSQEKVIMKTDLVDGYIKALPEGEKALSQTPEGQ